MKKESSTNLQKYSGIAEQMLKLFSKHPETAKVLFDIIVYGDEGEGNGISTTNKTVKRLRIVLLAGAYNLGFFYFYFLFFKLLCVYRKEKQQ